MQSPPELKPHQPGAWSRIKKYLLAGILVTAPAFLTLYVAIAIINIADRWVKSLLPGRFPDMRLFGIPGMGLVFMLALLIVIGLITTNWLGKKFVLITDHFFAKTPVLSSLYSTLKQLFHTFLGDNTNSFREVVYVEFPRDGCWSIGFVTSLCSESVPLPDQNMVYVFIPTTPNPTTGYLILIARDQIRQSGMTVEQGLKTVVSMGITR